MLRRVLRPTNILAAIVLLVVALFISHALAQRPAPTETEIARSRG